MNKTENYRKLEERKWKKKKKKELMKCRYRYRYIITQSYLIVEGIEQLQRAKI